MKKFALLLLVCGLCACQQSKTENSPLLLNTTDIKKLMAETDQLPIGEVIYQIEVDSKGNTIDTTAKEFVKYFANKKTAYSFKTHYENDNKVIAEQYFIPNGEFIYMKTSNQKFDYTQTAIPEIDSTGLVLGLTMLFKDKEKNDTINIEYNYTFNKAGEREKLILSTKKDSMNMRHHIHYKNNQAVREYDIANNDTINISYSEYRKSVITKSTSENYSNGTLVRSRESRYNRDGDIMSNSIYAYDKGQRKMKQQSNYKYDRNKRLKSIEVNMPKDEKTQYYRFLYVEK